MAELSGAAADFSGSERELIAQIAALLDALGPFPENTPRSAKWRTTEQLANEVSDRFASTVTLDHLTDVLTRYEDAARERLTRGEPAAALVRRATYPDRTTALPLWGSTKYHGQPWLGQAPASRLDEPADLPAALRVSHAAPRVFLSHTKHDGELAYRIATELARLDVGSWLFEAHVEHRGTISECVRRAIGAAARCLALVTRDSIASLWVLTELHTALQAGTLVTLVIDAADDELMKLSPHDSRIPTGCLTCR